MSEWIRYTGLQPNIDPETEVDIETNSGATFRQTAKYLDWENKSNPKNNAIMWYRVVPQIKSIDDAYDHLNNPNIFTTNTVDVTKPKSWGIDAAWDTLEPFSPNLFTYPKTNYVTKTDEELKEAEEKRKEALVETKQAKVEKLFEVITGRKISYYDYMLVKTLEDLITMHSK